MFRTRLPAILSIILDLVTDNQALLGDSLYLGLRRQRSSEAEMEEFIDESFMEMALMFPRHWCKLEVNVSLSGTLYYSGRVFVVSVGLFKWPRLFLLVSFLPKAPTY